MIMVWWLKCILSLWKWFAHSHHWIVFLAIQVDFAMDVFKNLYPDQDVPEGLFSSDKVTFKLLTNVECKVMDNQYVHHALENTANQNTQTLLYIVCLTVLHPAFPSCAAHLLNWLFFATFYAMVKIVVQHFIVKYHGKSHLSLVFSPCIHVQSPECLCAYQENSNDSWHIPYYTTQNHCTTPVVWLCILSIVDAQN